MSTFFQHVVHFLQTHPNADLYQQPKLCDCSFRLLIPLDTNIIRSIDGSAYFVFITSTCDNRKDTKNNVHMNHTANSSPINHVNFQEKECYVIQMKLLFRYT